MKFVFFILFVFLFEVFPQVKGTSSPGRIVIKKIVTPVFEDKNIPVITLLEPKEAVNLSNPQMPVRFSSKDKTLLIRVKISDESKLKIVTIDGVQPENTADSTYLIQKELKSGENRIVIYAQDIYNNSGTLSFVVTSITDTSGPLISIIEPVISEEKAFFVNEASQTIIIKAEDESGIAAVLINGLNAQKIEEQKYFANVSLIDGLNILTVAAKDGKGYTTEKEIKVNYESDVIPPFVTILEPVVTRGMTVVSKKEIIMLKGIANDENGIKEILINGRKVDLLPDGNFSLDIRLIVGDNMLLVHATDNKGNSGTDTFFVTRKLEELIKTGKFYALVIGIDTYKGIWPKLRNAANDAKAFSDLLQKDYTFDEVLTLFNEDATRTRIISELERLTTSVSKDDNVLIFYSGHGEFKNQLNKGYWVPVDAVSNSTAGYISNSDLQTFLNGINSKHTLLISDACFSGDIFRGRTDEVPFEDSERYFKEVYRRASRCALTSGGIEPVTDGGRDGHSVFTYYLLKKLLENEGKYFTAGQLFNELQIPVTNNSEQSPVYQPIKNTGDEGGQFIFVKKK